LSSFPMAFKHFCRFEEPNRQLLLSQCRVTSCIHISLCDSHEKDSSFIMRFSTSQIMAESWPEGTELVAAPLLLFQSSFFFLLQWIGAKVFY
jgi:hypothetical protein